MNRGVLMVTGAYWPEISGGGLQARTMIEALRERLRFTVFTTCTDAALPTESEIDGIKVTRVFVDVRRPSSKLRAVFATLRFFAMQAHSFDIVHLHGFSQKSVLIVLLARLLGKKIVLTVHTAGQDEPEAIRRLGRFTYWCYSQADRFIAVSEGVAASVRAAGLSSRLRVVANGVDTDRFRPVTPEERQVAKHAFPALPASLPWILFVGFFSKDKAPDVLFNAWLQLNAARPRSSALLFVGATASQYHEVDASLADRLRSTATERGVAELVHFAGEMSDVERAYRAADIFVMPSVREAFGMVLIEAMASGLPVVATHITGVTDAITGKDAGLLVAAGDEDALAAALTRLLGDRHATAAMGSRARTRAAERYGLGASAERWMSIYQEVHTS